MAKDRTTKSGTGTLHRTMSPPGLFLVRMLIFLTLVAFLAAILHQQLFVALSTNPGLNGLILGVLAIGILYSFRQVIRLYPEIRWVNAFRIADPGLAIAHRPVLLSPMATMLRDRTGVLSLSTGATRSIMDTIGSRLDEARDTGRYLVGLLVFLGLLGTFWGLLETVSSIANVISGLGTVGAAVAKIVVEQGKCQGIEDGQLTALPVGAGFERFQRFGLVEVEQEIELLPDPGSHVVALALGFRAVEYPYCPQSALHPQRFPGERVGKVEQEPGDPGVVEDFLIAARKGRSEPAPPGRFAPIPRRGNRSPVGGESHDERVVAVAGPAQLAQVQFAQPSHFGSPGIAHMGIVGPDHQPGVGNGATEVGQQGVERVGHVGVPQVPGVHVPLEHAAIVPLRFPDHPGVLFRHKKILFRVEPVGPNQLVPLLLKFAELLHHLLLAGPAQLQPRRIAVGLGIAAEQLEAAVAAPGPGCRGRIGTSEIVQHRFDRGVKAVQIEPVKPHRRAALPEPCVMPPEPAQERDHLDVPPHPGGKPLESPQRLLRRAIAALALHIAVRPVSVGPVGFDDHPVVAQFFNQEPGYDRALAVELVGAVGRLAQQYQPGPGRPPEQRVVVLRVSRQRAGAVGNKREWMERPSSHRYPLVLPVEWTPGLTGFRTGTGRRLGDLTGA